MPFNGRTALVTGAGGGLGQLATWRLAADGVQVVALDVDAAGLERTARHAPQVHARVVDVRDAAAVTEAVAETEADLGPIERVVTAASVELTTPPGEQSLDEIRHVTDVNYFGTVVVTQAALPAMLERQRGDVVHVGSLNGSPSTRRVGATAAAAAAVAAYHETLVQVINGRDVRVACACSPHGDASFHAEEVLDAVERALDGGELFALPGRSPIRTRFAASGAGLRARRPRRHRTTRS